MSIKISVPNDDHVALRAMAKALEEIAVARGAPTQNGPFTSEIKIDLSDDKVKERLERATQDLMQAAPAMLKLNDVDGSVEIHGKLKVVEVDTTGQQFESLNLDGRDVQKTGEMVQKVAPVVSDTDSTGTPWDERIHSASKALNTDGTWRVRRKPKDMGEEEWSEYVNEVKDELMWGSRQPGASEEHLKVVSDETLNQVNQVTEAPLSEEWDGQGENLPKPYKAISEPTVTPAGDDFHVDAGVVTEQEVASIPAPPLPVPPAPLFATVQEVDEPAYTFPQVMQFLTERHGRITSAQVDDIIADMGLNSIMDLNTQPEHTGPFIARVKALLGE